MQGKHRPPLHLPPAVPEEIEGGADEQNNQGKRYLLISILRRHYRVYRLLTWGSFLLCSDQSVFPIIR